VAALIAFQIPIAAWEKSAPWLFVASLVLLICGADSRCGQSGLWRAALDIRGPFSFQPSELAKFAVLLYAADYMVRKMEVKERFFRAVMPMGVGGGGGGPVAAGRAGHGWLHGDCGDRHGHPVSWVVSMPACSF
jgi:cell division protein FtsW